MRFLLFLLICVLLISPWLVSSICIDTRGVTVPGVVAKKQEEVTVKNSAWTRSATVTVQYDPPGEQSPDTVFTKLPLERFDSLRVGSPIDVHYLKASDLPNYPGVKPLREIHFVVVARLAERTTFSGLREIFDAATVRVLAIIAGAIALVVLAVKGKLPGLGWVVAGCVVMAAAYLLQLSLPTVTPEPIGQRATAMAKITTLERIDRLFDTSRSRGTPAKQPVQVVAFTFVPSGRTEPVVAVDQIDDGSMAGMALGDTVEVTYEIAQPRTARINGGTRYFEKRNLIGLAYDAVTLVGAIVVMLLIAKAVGAWFRKLIAK